MPDIKNYNDVYQYIADLEAENKKLKVEKFIWMVIADQQRSQFEDMKDLERSADDLDKRIKVLEAAKSQGKLFPGKIYIEKEEAISFLNDLFGEMVTVTFGDVVRCLDSLQTYLAGTETDSSLTFPYEDSHFRT